ncbi:MAG: hemagglutinin repeat-containing protein [Actinobacteria bacterium]|nr:hemagglutinin repeat-containing protein [Actinomycetota bacterium]
MIVEVDHTPATRTRSQRGVATVEFAGIIFVVMVIMSGVVSRMDATPYPSAFWWGVCKAYSTAPGVTGIQCGTPPSGDPANPDNPAAEDRADDLNIACVASQTNRTDGINVVVYGIRVGEGGTDEIRINADGTATVTLSQTTEAGVEAAIANGSLKGSVYAVGNGELKYTYNFPDAASAKKFLDERRNVLNRVTDTVIPGAQTLNELSTRLGNWMGENIGDKMPWVSDADRAANDQERANNTADAISIAVGAKANASGKVGTGDIKGQAEIELSAKGEALVNFDSSKGSSFTGTVEGKLSAGVSAKFGDPKNGVGALFGVSAQGGAKGGYKVVFDSDGNPTQLVLTRELTGQAVGDATLQAGTAKLPGAKGGVGGIWATTWTLDLSDPANRAAFDATFTVGSVSAGDYTGAVALPNLSMTPEQISKWLTLADRIDADSYEANYKYVLASGSVSPSDKDYELKEGVFGAGLTITETSRMLNSATGRDHRTGGPEVPLATCE